MKLAPDIAESVGIAAQRWAESLTDLPLVITKTPDGAIVTQSLPQQRFTKGQFATALDMSRTTFARVERDYGLEPAKSDGCYDRETVEDVKRWLRQEEQRTAPPQTRR